MNEVQSQATPEIQAQAEKMGWIPPARFKGDPERFVDADAYVERGETVLPIVKEHNKRLTQEVETLRAESAKTAAALKAAELAIAQLEERNSVATQKAVEAARRQVKAQLAAASEADDHEGVAELTEQLIVMNAAEKEAKKAPVVLSTPAPTSPAIDPAMTAWNADNPWFGTDKRKTAFALAVAEELRANGERAQGRDFYELIGAEVEATFSSKDKSAPVDKVEGARNGSSAEIRGKKSYASMPADARAACDADARNFVGEKKKFKTIADWRNRYAELYFQE